MVTKLGLVCLSLCLSAAFSMPTVTDQGGLVVSTEASKEEEIQEPTAKEEAAAAAPPVPKIYEMKVDTNVTNRFAKTSVKSKVKNLAKTAQEATFSVVLPETAYITGFVMEVGGKSYEAYVKEKQEAKQIYNEAVGRGQAAAHVEVNARDSNRFTVSVNVEPQSKAVFTLTYEELLQRQSEQYEVVINIHPGQPVKDLNVEVHINESRPLRFVKSPPLRSGNEISKNDEKLNSLAQIDVANSTSATVKFSPDVERQKQLAAGLGTKEENGLAGQFVVQYDVERDPAGGEVLLKDGYFVHFFAPSDLPPLPKQVVFVLDTSGSMDGIRIKQLREAMNSILAELKDGDVFNVVEFSSTVRVWDVPKVEATYELGDDPWSTYRDPESTPKIKEKQELPPAFKANAENIEKAKQVVDKLVAFGGTDIMSALEVALDLVKKHKEDEKDEKHQPIIVFLTDGEPTVGEINTNRIISTVSERNNGDNRSPIFSLSFGDGADRDFLQKISLKNSGFARHIYEAADASLQLQEFYKQISSPLLSNVEFKYVSNVTKVTKTKFPIFFLGSELVVAGKMIDEGFARPICTADSFKGPIELVPNIEKPVGDLERLWAYLTIKQILEARDAAEDKESHTKKALDIALKYSFVTPVSSLVVVKPNDTSAVDTEDASKSTDRPYFLHRKFALGGAGGYGNPSLSLAAPLNSFPRPQYAAFPMAGTYNVAALHPSALLPQPQPTFEVDDVNVEASVESGSGFIYIPSTTALPQQTTVKQTDLYEDLKNKLPWLKDALSENGTLTLTSGDYQLGIDASIEQKPECLKTPGNNTAGVCRTLIQCPQVYPHLTNLTVFEEYFCKLDMFVGVCCPNSEESSSQISVT